MQTTDADIVGDHRVVHDLRDTLVIGRNGHPRKRVLFVLGGGQAGIVSAERLRVFADVGITADSFDLIVGISAGAYNSLGFAAQQTGILRDLYFAFCEFPMRTRMYELVSEIERQFDRATFERSTPEVLIGVSDGAGRLSLPSAKSEPNLFGLLYAASAIPPFTYGIDPRGNYAYDGAFAHPCPIRKALHKASVEWERNSEIDIIVLANRPRPSQLPWYDPIAFWWGVNVVLRMWAPDLCPGANMIDAKVDQVIPMFERRRKRLRTCAWFPHPCRYIGPWEWNPFTLKRHADAIRDETAAFLESTE